MYDDETSQPNVMISALPSEVRPPFDEESSADAEDVSILAAQAFRGLNRDYRSLTETSEDSEGCCSCW